MTIYLDKIYENSQTHPVLSSCKETMEKSKKIAISAIIVYLKDKDKTVCLPRTYSVGEALENLDLVTELEDYPNKIQLPCKKRKMSVDPTPDCVVATPSHLQPVTVNKEIQRDFCTVLRAVMKDGLELRHASRRLQNNEVIVFHAVRQNGLALQYTSKKQIQSNHIVLQAVRQNGLALQYASPALRDRFDIVAAAVRQNNLAFSFASKRLQADAEIIGFANGIKINNGLYTQQGFPPTFSYHHRSITSN